MLFLRRPPSQGGQPEGSSRRLPCWCAECQDPLWLSLHFPTRPPLRGRPRGQTRFGSSLSIVKRHPAFERSNRHPGSGYDLARSGRQQTLHRTNRLWRSFEQAGQRQVDTPTASQYRLASSSTSLPQSAQQESDRCRPQRIAIPTPWINQSRFS